MPFKLQIIRTDAKNNYSSNGSVNRNNNYGLATETHPHRPLIMLLSLLVVGSIILHILASINASWFTTNLSLSLPAVLGTHSPLFNITFLIGYQKICTSDNDGATYSCVEKPDCSVWCNLWTTGRVCGWIGVASGGLAALGVLWALWRGFGPKSPLLYSRWNLMVFISSCIAGTYNTPK